MYIYTYSELRSKLKDIMNTSADSHEPAIISRPGGEHMVILSLEDFESLKESAYLLRGSANRAFLERSMAECQAKKLEERESVNE